jgi:hypothetical protein
MAVLERAVRAGAATFTQPLQDEASVSPLESGKSIHQQKLDVVLRPRIGKGP